MQGSAKNPPWARSNVNTNITGINPQIMDPNAMAMSQQGMMGFQQNPVFNPNIMQSQSGVSMGNQLQMNQIAQGQMFPGNVVAYPTPRALAPNMYQNQSNNSNPGPDQRVFTGIVTKVHHKDFGFVDHDVFYQTSVCAKGALPKVNDRVLVEATYNANMPFKWNATRIQVIPNGNNMSQNKSTPMKNSNYNAVPPPSGKRSISNRSDDRTPRREERKRSRTRSRSRSRERREPRPRRETPPRKRPAPRAPSPTTKYYVRVPRIPLDIQKLDVPSLNQRYVNLYVPSDFFNARIHWGETFPPETPFSLNNPCSYHIMPKEAENPVVNDAVLDPPDADYRFSAKVMLISMPPLESLYQKCGLTKVDEKEKDRHSSTKSTNHPTRLIKFLVGVKGRGGENFAIGGPWSPSLDGPNPQSDPQVLVRTAIRTCKALTGIDLTPCTQWYRMVEFYYWRESGGRSRPECVVLFLPDVWSAQTPRLDWSDVQETYKAASDAALAALDADQSGELPEISQIGVEADNSVVITIDENDDDPAEKSEPTHYSKINLRTIKQEQLKQELRARNVSFKGLRPQLISRLSKLLKMEESKNSEDPMVIEDDEGVDIQDTADITIDQDYTQEEDKDKDKTEIELKDDKKEVKEKKPKLDEKQLEKERAAIKSRYEIPSTPHLIVHPNNSAKGGKFSCSIATLSLLLDYRNSDNKEHSFEVFVFAELFNEMLMRDFGFYVYKTLYTLPEKIDNPDKSKEKAADKKDDKSDKKDDKADKKDDKTDKKDDKTDKKDEKVDIKREKTDKKEEKTDKKDVRKKERRDSRSDDESRSASPSATRKVARVSRGVDLPSDPYLLLALVYFDTTRCGHYLRRDLQTLFMGLGLQLSRSQIISILDKVCIKDDFSYKTLMQTIKDISTGATEVNQDLPLETVIASTDVPEQISELEANIARGNRNIIPIFDHDKNASPVTSERTKELTDGSLVTFKNRLVDVGALLSSTERAERQRVKLEAALVEARGTARTFRVTAAHAQSASRHSQSQLAEVTAKLAASKERIASLSACCKIFHSALESVQNKVESVINIKYEDDDVVEVVNGPAKSDSDKKSEKSEDKTESKEKFKEPKEEPDVCQPENMDLDDK